MGKTTLTVTGLSKEQIHLLIGHINANFPHIHELFVDEGYPLALATDRSILMKETWYGDDNCTLKFKRKKARNV